ncbi:MAG TPA: hypothetical protein P5149_10295, partial [Candidatus Competibacteraceae bacterium]|nr:hypothetical protein [Candidatus Competibacteraceae bacterium]
MAATGNAAGNGGELGGHARTFKYQRDFLSIEYLVYQSLKRRHGMEGSSTLEVNDYEKATQY